MKIQKTLRSQIGFVQDFDTCGHGVPTFPIKVNKTIGYGLKSVRDFAIQAVYDSARQIATITVKSRPYYGRKTNQTSIVEHVSWRMFVNFTEKAPNLMKISVI
jgi:hypothetical protein